MMKNRFLTDTVVVLLGSLLLCSHALYNGYPLLYPDTGTYIAACFQHFIPFDRPVNYCFFVRHTSLSASLWLVIVAQSLILSWLILVCFRYFGRQSKPYLPFLLTLLLLVCVTGISVNASQVIPDVFTSVILLASGLLLLVKELPRRTMIAAVTLLVFGTGTHFSHFPLLFGLIALTAIIAWFRRKKIQLFTTRRFLLLGGSLLSSVFLLMLLNFTTGGRWQFRPIGEHAFRMNRLIACGIMDDYLDKKCMTDSISLCRYRSTLHADFLWSQESPLNRTYGYGEKGWLAAKPEYDRIISDVFSYRSYLLRFISCSLRDTWKQLFAFDTGTVPPQGENSAPYGVVNWHLHGDITAYMKAKQQNGTLSYTLFNKIQNVFIIATSLLLLLAFAWRKTRLAMSRPSRMFFLFLCIAMLLNALSVVTFAMVDNRFQSRLIWLLPLFCGILLSDNDFRKNISAIFAGRKQNT